MDYEIVFIDTEFTGFVNAKTISVGFAALSGLNLYVELLEDQPDGWSRADCSDFVVERVLPLLGPPENRLTIAEARTAIRCFLDGLANRVILLSDSPYHDEPALLSLFTGRMDDWPQDAECKLAEFRPVADHRPDVLAHHALHDAVALRDAYLSERQTPAAQAAASSR